MKRRTWMAFVAAAPIAARVGTAGSQQRRKGEITVEELQASWKDLVPADMEVPSATDKVQMPREEWKKRLAPDAYRVLREDDTEPAGTSPLNAEKRAGVFVCAGCGLPLFTSAMKYESGTGWPSFFTAIPGALATKRDFKLILPRTEYHCARCGGHQGHVFNDGPAPTGQRWCNNGVALKFMPKG